MRLENLFQNFGRSSPEDQLKYIVEYRLRRATDLEVIPKAKPITTTKKLTLDLTDEEKALMKLLGIKKKDIVDLRAANNGDAEESGSGEELFKDDTYEEGDSNE